MKSLRWRTIFVTLITLACAYAASPTVIYFLQDKEVRGDAEAFLKKVPSWLPQKHVRLGLDLQGGSQLVLGVNTDDAIENKLNQIAVDTGRWADEEKLGVDTAFVEKNSKTLTIRLKADADADNFNSLFLKANNLLERTGRKDAELSYRYKESEVGRIKQSALEQAEKVVHARINQWGVSEPTIFRRADGSILVQLPGFRDPQKAKELLGRTAQLKFKLVDDSFTGFANLTNPPQGITQASHGSQVAFSSEDREALEAFLKPHVPADHELLFEQEKLGSDKSLKYRYVSYVVHAATLLTGSDIHDANITAGGGIDRKPAVGLQFTPQGGKRFAEVTGANVNKRLAIILDDVVQSAPVIQGKIPNGQASISLGKRASYNEIVEEGTQLALVLKSGAIPATITILEEREVGATLGPELANQGIKGVMFGLLCVFIFMLIYYRRSGAIACFVLLLNGVMLLAAMSLFGFVLTLPGIAAFVLTLGMAVDANVLINERIRQELREGKNPRKAVEFGFGKVFWTIIDSNVTTLIAALVLLEASSSGPIRGFAITLMIGLIISMFTSLYCTRLCFDTVLAKVSDKNIRTWLGWEKDKKARHFNFNFISLTKPFTYLTIFAAVAVLIASLTKGVNFGVDFRGGTEVTIAFQQDVDPDKVRDIAEQAHIEGLSVQALDGGKKQYLLRYEESKSMEGTTDTASATASETFVAFKTALMEQLKEFGPEVLQVDFVGPQVGKELRTQGILSVFYAILAIFLYIAFRFDMRFGPGAMVKMTLDVLIMLAFYVFFGASFDLVAVAAFLTVVGYSVNDTIVIYDRIRENITEAPRRTIQENINFALNETLTRSINTSFATAVSLAGILIFATGQVWQFAMALTLGIVIATFTSTFVATCFVVWLESWRNKRAPLKS